MSRQKETVLVTGSSGFIGRALIDKLTRRFQVVGLDIMEPPALPPNARFFL